MYVIEPLEGIGTIKTVNRAKLLDSKLIVDDVLGTENKNQTPEKETHCETDEQNEDLYEVFTKTNYPRRTPSMRVSDSTETKSALLIKLVLHFQ